MPIRAVLLFVIAVCIASAQVATVLSITSASPLPPGVVGASYLQTLSAGGGTPPYSWQILPSALPPGLAFSTNGTISGVPVTAGTYTVSIQVTDNAGARVTQTFAISIIAGATFAQFGVISHIAAGGTWSTAITLVNSSPQPVPLRVNFHGDDGSAWNLPLVVAQQGSSQPVTTAGLDGALNPNTTMVISTGALPSLVAGWAEVLSPGPLGGYGIFRYTPPAGPASECTVPLQTQSPSSVVMAYDNTTGLAMGVAFANPSASSTDITATIFDDNGSQLGMQTFTLSGKGHTALNMPGQIPLSAGKRGIAKFQSSGSGGIAILGLRFSSIGTFTSVPGQ